MADENDTNSTIEAVEVAAPEPKKQRAPRQKKVIAEVTAPAPAVAVKSPRAPRKKRVDPVVEAAPAIAESESKPGKGRKGVGRPKTAAKAPKAEIAPAGLSAVDEFADLIKLEEENKSLRKALSEKLRAENADLRKRLGQA